MPDVNRRAFLKGASVALALPAWESLIGDKAFAAAAARPRFFALFFANGIMNTEGFWYPKGSESNWTLSPALAPLKQHKQDLVVVEGLVNRGMIEGDKDHGTYAHANESASFLSGTSGLLNPNSKWLPKPNIKHGTTTFDQVLADRSDAPIPSLALNVCPYQSAVSAQISFRQGVPVPHLLTSKALFERLFVNGPNLDQSKSSGPSARGLLRRNILDFVTDDIKRYRSRILGADDRARLDEYLSAVKQAQENLAGELGLSSNVYRCDKPAATPLTADDNPKDAKIVNQRYKNMVDMSVLAVKCGLTDVVTIAMTPASGHPVLKYVDPTKSSGCGLHYCSHYNAPDRGGAKETFKAFQLWESERFAYLLDTIKSNGVFDDSVIFYGCAMGDANGHHRKSTPTIISGGAGGKLKRNRFLRFDHELGNKNRLFLAGETPRENVLAAVAQDLLGLDVSIHNATGKVQL